MEDVEIRKFNKLIEFDYQILVLLLYPWVVYVYGILNDMVNNIAKNICPVLSIKRHILERGYRTVVAGT